MLNSDVYWITCEMVVTCDLLCWITTILACMLVGLKSLVISLDYRSYMGSSARIWSFRWLFLYLCSYNLDGSITCTPVYLSCAASHGVWDCSVVLRVGSDRQLKTKPASMDWGQASWVSVGQPWQCQGSSCQWQWVMGAVIWQLFS
jgi:hypothetical protein